MSRIAPQLEWDMRGSVGEIFIRRQQGELIATTKLNEQSVYGADLDAPPSAHVADLCGTHMILPVRLDQWQRSKPLDDGAFGFRPAEALEQFLRDQACCDDGIGAVQCLAQSHHLPGLAGAIAP